MYIYIYIYIYIYGGPWDTHTQTYVSCDSLNCSPGESPLLYCDNEHHSIVYNNGCLL